MDKRKTVGTEKFNLVHRELISKSKQILASSSFLDLTFQNLSKSSNYSKTTIYYHFNSDINLLYHDVLKSFRIEISKNIEEMNIKDSKQYIFSIYENIFDYIEFNPNLYKNLFLIAVLLTGTNYIGQDQVTPLLEKLTIATNKKINFKEHWSRFTAVSIQYAITEDTKIKQKIKAEFFKKLNSILT